ncbi:MAG: DUF11 domain-containing protein, partial [Planctomycetota bacterium]|nr:DUF11 domain-containing protein [Planctomycetota bacterium]
MYGTRRAFWLLLILPLAVACSCRRTQEDDGSKTTTIKTAKSGGDTMADSGSNGDAGSSMTRRGDMNWASRAFPTGNKNTSALMIERGSPDEVILGQDYEYVIKVTNLTDGSLENVVVSEHGDGNMKVSSTTPKASSMGKDMTWNLGNLGPRKSKTIRVKGSAAKVGNIDACCDARWDAVVCSTVKVVQPKLSLVKTGTKAVLLCDPISYKLTVANGGTGPARNVVINNNLPAGVTTLGGKKSVRINVGTLNPGQSKDYTIRAKASKAGSFNCMATATADGLSAKSGTVTTRVTAPKLAITKTGSRKAFIGRSINYEITVKNTGNGIAKDTTVTDQLPSGATFVSASDGGSLSGGNVVWNLGTLNPGDSRKLTMRVKAGNAADVRNTATAKAYCAEAVTATHVTKVTGIPAVLLEVIDIEDPIEVG